MALAGRTMANRIYRAMRAWAAAEGMPRELFPENFDIAKWEGHPVHPSRFKAGMRRGMTRRLAEETKWKHPIRALLRIFGGH